jgi:hypothetical protein
MYVTCPFFFRLYFSTRIYVMSMFRFVLFFFHCSYVRLGEIDNKLFCSSLLFSLASFFPHIYSTHILSLFSSFFLSSNNRIITSVLLLKKNCMRIREFLIDRLIDLKHKNQKKKVWWKICYCSLYCPRGLCDHICLCCVCLCVCVIHFFFSLRLLFAKHQYKTNLLS